MKVNATRFWYKHDLNKFACLALTIWVAHFFYFRDFGLYEDDYTYISPTFGWNLSNLLHHAVSVFRNWPQGRPLGYFLPQFFSFIGTQLGGEYVTYLIAFVIIALNAFLFYTLLKRATQESTAFIGALAFCLFPADTTHPFLMHALGLQTSLTFLLIASHCYLSGKRSLSYLIILGALLTYESPFMVFVGIPLLKSEVKWDRLWRRELIRHIAILTGIVLVVVAIRVSMGEQRATDLGGSISSSSEIPAKIIQSIFIGPATSLSLFFDGPIRTLSQWNWQLAIIFVGGWAIFIWVLCWHKIKSLNEKRSHPIASPPRIVTDNGTVQTAAYHLGIAKLVLAAAVFLGLAYVTSFTHFPPTASFGRVTSVHLAAAFGGSLLVACVCSVILSTANAYRLKNLAIVGLVAYLLVVVAYRFSIQLDFKQAWQNERSFWSSTLEISPDMTDGTVIFVLDHDLPHTQYILTHSWADAIMLTQIYQFPSEWKNPPRLFVVQNDWTDHLVQQGDKFKWEVPTATWPAHWEVLPSSNVILLEMQDGKLVRRFGSIQINGQDFEFKPLPVDVKLNFEKGPLYNYLIDEASYHSSR